MKNTIKRSQSGFSLVELMVVIAIIGILTTIAVPSLQSFREEARKVQAKTELSHMYTLFSAFHLSKNTYVAADLVDLGYVVSGAIAERYYSVGFGGSPIAAWPLLMIGETYAVGGVCSTDSPAMVGATLAPATYSLRALGCPKENANQLNRNVWSIDHNRSLTEVDPGT